MKKTCFCLFIILVLAACNNQNDAPDISKITLKTTIDRFDENFFSLDTNDLGNGLTRLQAKYPEFLPVFLQNIVGVENEQGARDFFRSYKPVFDSSQRLYKNFEPVKNDIEEGLRYATYYFPQYKAPSRVMPVVGPMNTLNDMAKMANGELTPNFIGPDFIGISLQFYLGRDFSLYNEEYFINNVVPRYRSRRFSKEYIAADVMKLIADDIFPDRSNTRPLIEQMIEKGKHWWLIDKFLPGTHDSLKTGYTGKQLEWCRENEGLIWSYIVKNENLYDLSPATIQTYIGEAPFTQGFSQEDSPGNLGPWLGRQIVKKFVEKNPEKTPGEIMQVSAKQILEEAKYKPK